MNESYNVYSYRIWYLKRGFSRLSLVCVRLKAEKGDEMKRASRFECHLERNRFHCTICRRTNLELLPVYICIFSSTLNTPSPISIICCSKRATFCKINPVEKPDLLHIDKNKQEKIAKNSKRRRENKKRGIREWQNPCSVCLHVKHISTGIISRPWKKNASGKIRSVILI